MVGDAITNVGVVVYSARFKYFYFVRFHWMQQMYVRTWWSRFHTISRWDFTSHCSDRRSFNHFNLILFDHNVKSFDAWPKTFDLQYKWRIVSAFLSLVSVHLCVIHLVMSNLWGKNKCMLIWGRHIYCRCAYMFHRDINCLCMPLERAEVSSVHALCIY